MTKTLYLCLLTCCTFGATAQTLRRVPAAYKQIQQAIDAAQEGDTVLVSPGVYRENLQFRGRNIVLSSRYFLESNPAEVIRQTIIDGSQPRHADTASCILIWQNEGPQTVVQGFTLTGGSGTLWYDHYLSKYFREGGAILTEFASPVIRHNIIRNNHVPKTGKDVASNGGGGLRCGDGSPLIEGNYIAYNVAEGYGGGLVLNYCPDAIVRNNLIAHNRGGQDYSGAGFWATGADSNSVVHLRHNTIACNESPEAKGKFGGKGGGIWAFTISLDLENNIVWGNRQALGAAIAGSHGARFQAQYNCIEGGFPGKANISKDPIFRDTVFFVPEIGSPAIDAGAPSGQDRSLNKHRAVFPARGALQADLGVYGGNPGFSPAWLSAQALIFSKVQQSPVVQTPGDSRSVNWIDIDGDQDQDLMITNGPQGGENNFLYRNNGNGAFEKVQNDPIVQDGKPSDGASWADYDNDGDNDCFVVNWYGVNNLLYRNKGDGSFEQITTGAPVTDGGFSETASWGDYNNDGLLDLYVTNSDDDLKNFLYKNTGNGAFEKITTGAPVSDTDASRCVNWTDYDNDGDADLFVTNESNQQERLYKNTNGVFSKVLGIAPVQAGGKTMSASWGDYNNDGFQDLFLANDQSNDFLFKNEGAGTFSSVTGTPVSSSGGNSFGSQWADVDNDGDLDLFVANAFWGGPWKNFLFLNQGNGSFVRDTAEWVSKDLGWSYGAAFGDLDRDGDLDLAVANCYNATQTDYLYENHSSENGAHWFVVQCTGVQSNRSAIGAKVYLTALINGQERRQMREISAQSGYCGQNQLAAHFGLGDATQVVSLVVHWPSGIRDSLSALPANAWVNIVENKGLSALETPELKSAGIRVLTPAPNPFHDTVNCRFEVTRNDALLAIELLDQHGRKVQEWPLQRYTAGEHNIKWSAATQGNIPAGNYWFVFKSEGEISTKYVVKVH